MSLITLTYARATSKGNLAILPSRRNPCGGNNLSWDGSANVKRCSNFKVVLISRIGNITVYKYCFCYSNFDDALLVGTLMWIGDVSKSIAIGCDILVRPRSSQDPLFYSGTPPYDHPVYKTTSLLRPYSFKPKVKNIDSFYYFEDPVNATTSLLRPGFYGPTVVVLTGFHCRSPRSWSSKALTTESTLGQHFIGTFDRPWSKYSGITDRNLDHSKENAVLICEHPQKRICNIKHMRVVAPKVPFFLCLFVFALFCQSN